MGAGESRAVPVPTVEPCPPLSPARTVGARYAMSSGYAQAFFVLLSLSTVALLACTAMGAAGVYAGAVVAENQE